jgi:prevent-host-death family protein
VNWQIQDAKQRFSEVLRAAATGGPQIVTRHGKEIAVVIDIDEYRQLRGQSSSFMAFLRADPIADDTFEIERQSDLPREIDLAG